MKKAFAVLIIAAVILTAFCTVFLSGCGEKVVITLDAQGGSAPAEQGESELNYMPSSALDGYMLYGWATKPLTFAELTEDYQGLGLYLVNFPYCPQESVTLYAVWGEAEDYATDYMTPVVYATDAGYQIIWETSFKGVGYVTVNNVKYVSSVNGAVLSDRTIHKVTVPAEALDSAKQYSISSYEMYNRGAYTVNAGNTVTVNCEFRPVDDSDGLQYVSISDNHSIVRSAVTVGRSFEDKLDFLIMCGDNADSMENLESARIPHRIAYAVTGGTVPVIQLRGNHETRGAFAEYYPDYVPSNSVDGGLYFTFRIGNVWGLALDLGEDKADNHQEYSGLADYASYRVKETQYITDAVAAKGWEEEGVTYRILVCHIPLPLYTQDATLKNTVNLWSELIEDIPFDAGIFGHTHTLTAYMPSYSGLSYPYFVTGKSIAYFNDTFAGTVFEYKDDALTYRFMDKNGEVTGEELR